MTDYNVGVKYNVDSTGLTRARQTIKGVTNDLKSSEGTARRYARNFASGMRVAGTAAAGVATALGAITVATLRNNQAINDAALFTGDSTENIADLTGALQLAGAEIDQISNIINTVNERVEEASAGSETFVNLFSQLGLSIEELRNSSPTEVLEDIVIAINNLEDSSLRAAAINQIIGEGDADVLKLADSYDELNSRVARARLLGITVGEQQREAAQRLEDYTNQVNGAATAIRNQLTQSLVELIGDTEDFSEKIDEITIRTRLAIMDGADVFESYAEEFDFALDIGNKWLDFQTNIIRFWGDAYEAAKRYFNEVNGGPDTELTETQRSLVDREFGQDDITRSIDFTITGLSNFTEQLTDAFESGGITFTPDGKLRMSTELEAPDRESVQAIIDAFNNIPMDDGEAMIDFWDRLRLQFEAIEENYIRLINQNTSLSEALGIQDAVASAMDFQMSLNEAIEALDTGDYGPIRDLLQDNAAITEIILQRRRQLRDVSEQETEEQQKQHQLWLDKVKANDAAYQTLTQYVDKLNSYDAIMQDINSELDLQRDISEAIAMGQVQSQEELMRFTENEREIRSILNDAKSEGVDITEEEIRMILERRRQLEAENNILLRRREDYLEFLNGISEGFGDVLSDSIIDALDTGRFEFDNFLNDLGRMLLQSGLREIMAQIFTPQGSNEQSLFTSFITSFISGMAGGGASSSSGSSGGSGWGGFAADGAVIHGTSNHRGFTMAEQGPEAIMPLGRDSSGRLGVRTTGAMGGAVVYNFNNNVTVNGSDTPDRTAQATTRALEKMVDRKIKSQMVEQRRAGNMLNSIPNRF